MTKLFERSESGKAGAMDGINLFFGALLGANLGTLGDLKLVAYVQLMAVLVGTVMALRIFSTAENRKLAVMLLGVYMVALAVLVAVPGFQPSGMRETDLHRLVATLTVWVAMVVMLEIFAARLARRQTTVAIDDAG